MRPTRWLLTLILFWGLAGLAASCWNMVPRAWVTSLAGDGSPEALRAQVSQGLRWGWSLAGALLAVASLVDMLGAFARPALIMKRKPPSRFALGIPEKVEVTLVNRGRAAARVEVFDGIPAETETEEMPWRGTVPARGFTRFDYSIKPMKRGRLDYTPAHILHYSPLGLWQRASKIGVAEPVKVYPNYEPIIRYSMLAIGHREDQMGIVHRNKKGVSREFHQLRDYHEGDVLSQIDWKASAKHRTLITREYREQRDQNIILMVDSGRRMRAVDGDLPQFDHCLNAMLLMSFIALRQGDNVGVLSFGGTNRWLPPMKGAHAMTTLLNHLYDYETTTQPSDFSEAAERLLARQRRRALVVVLTNLRSEDANDVIPALRIIQRKHLVLLASLREQAVQKCVARPVKDFDDAVLFGATHLYLEERNQVFERLRGHGITMIDETAQQLPIALTNAYLEIKNTGRL